MASTTDLSLTDHLWDVLEHEIHVMDAADKSAAVWGCHVNMDPSLWGTFESEKCRINTAPQEKLGPAW